MFGTVTARDGKVVHNLFGKWTEALYCGVAPSVKCIWRPGKHISLPQFFHNLIF